MDFGILIRNGGDFFFKNNSLFILLLKKCLYLCIRIKNKTTKNKYYESTNTNQDRHNYSCLFYH